MLISLRKYLSVFPMFTTSIPFTELTRDQLYTNVAKTLRHSDLPLRMQAMTPMAMMMREATTPMRTPKTGVMDRPSGSGGSSAAENGKRVRCRPEMGSSLVTWLKSEMRSKGNE